MAAPNANYTGDPKSHPISSFSTSITGTCNCGSISVTIHDNLFSTPQRGHLCYCANCRKTAGSFVASNLMIERENVEILDKENTLRVFEDWNTGSGKCVRRSFCSRCGNPIKSESENFPDMLILKTGLLPRIPKPEFTVFTGHRHEWVPGIEGCVEWVIGKNGPKIGE